MTLLVMAAGMGSRYGGVKQIDPMGENGEIIIDYSLFDAIRAGFDKAVFVIRRDIEKDFCAKFFDRIKGKINATYVFQETPSWRKKPFGTTSAVLAAKDYIHEPFCVINADDYYGRDAFEKIAKFFKEVGKSERENAIVTYKLANTLSDNGTVTRGIITSDAHKRVQKIKDHFAIARNDVGTRFPADTNVNMNFFGFMPSIFKMLEKQFNEFLKENAEDPAAECLLPECIGELNGEGKINLHALESVDKWVGLTNPQDKQFVKTAIANLVINGVYPSPLWK